MATAYFSRSSLPQQLLAAKENALANFFSVQPSAAFSALAAQSHPEHNVVGIGVGRKLVKGKPTAQHCVRFYVERKLAESAIPKQFLLPKRLGNVITDVVETGRLHAFANPERGKLRPIRPGCSIGFQSTTAGEVMAGTLGALVEADGKRYMLSNNHVLAGENSLSAGAAILQPGLLDKNDPGSDKVGALARFIKLQVGGPNKVDCAIAELNDGMKSNPAVMPRVNKLKSGDPVSAVENMQVEKTGRTTGYTTGVIHDVSATVKINYDQLGVLTFSDQIMIGGASKPFSDAGDSGSLIVERKTKRPVGLLFGGSAKFTVANHINDVLAELKVKIVA